MKINISNDHIYCLDRVNYEQTMAISQMAFILMHHVEDTNDDFLISDIFKRLHQKLVTATVQKWCTENQAKS